MSLLAPEKRILLTDRFRPDPGYRLDHALVTSFTLDLTTLMEIPVALTFQEWDEANPDDELTRIGILDAIQRHIGSLTVVSQAGYVSGPPTGHPLLPLLEPALHTVPMPKHRTFHPKATLLRYTKTPEHEADDPEVRYRLIVSSRNLAPSRAWDTIVVLDGAVSENETESARRLDQFIDGVKELAGNSPGGLPADRRQKLEQMATEAPRIEFELPAGMEGMKILPLGLGSTTRLEPIRPTRDGYDRLLVSPFLGPSRAGDDTVLTRYAGPQATLISRQEELDQLPAEVRDSYGEVMVLSELTQAVFEDAGEMDADSTADEFRQGLHAKLLVENHGWKSRIVIGSANLTERAWRANIELALEFTAWKSENGVSKILGSDDREGLRRYLEPYRPAETEDEPENPDLETAEANLDRTAALLAGHDMTLDFPDSDGETRDLTLTFSGSPGPLAAGVEVRARPVTLAQKSLVALEMDRTPAAAWKEVSVRFITSLFDVELTATVGGETVTRRFVIKANLGSPIPEDRDQLIVRSLIENTEHLMSYIAMLLADTADDPGCSELRWKLPSTNDRLETRKDQAVFPLLERMIQAVDRDPTAIDRIAAIVKDLETDESKKKVLPEGFKTVWDPILEARAQRDGIGLV